MDASTCENGQRLDPDFGPLEPIHQDEGGETDAIVYEHRVFTYVPECPPNMSDTAVPIARPAPTIHAL